MTMMFNDIRFHLNLGKYRFAFYSHSTESSVDGQERLRILQKDLHGFGRPSEVDEQKKLKWATLFEKKSEKAKKNSRQSKNQTRIMIDKGV